MKNDKNRSNFQILSCLLIAAIQDSDVCILQFDHNFS